METANTLTDGGFNFDNSYLTLPADFYRQQLPTPVKAPSLVLFNDALADTLNVAGVKAQAAQYLSGNQVYPGAVPIAQAYAGHQFGHLNMLGDGRAILLGEHIGPDQLRVDIQLKGAGRTPYSRSGDGRAALGPMLREYIISEAMYALGIPSTRSLAVVATGEEVYRDDAYPGAVLTRVAASHIRVGTFQFAAAKQDPQLLQSLADYCIQRHFPEIIRPQLNQLEANEIEPAGNKYLALLKQVIASQAYLISRWMQVGFIHGVMNTDNMSICGESIDYGPCAFINRYHPQAVFSSIDSNGRYAFGNQPKIAHWNLIRFAETLLPLISDSEDTAVAELTACLETYPDKFLGYWLDGMRNKLGLFDLGTDLSKQEDTKLAEDLLMYMQKHHADYTNTFHSLSTPEIRQSALFADAGFENWYAAWQQRLAAQPQSWDDSLKLMRANNPQVIPRNHLVEAALSAAVDNNDLSLVQELLAVIANPYQDVTRPAKYLEAPDPLFDQHYKTFCGT